MKFLRKIFDNAHAKLNKSEKTKKFFPLVDAIETLMFTPNHVTKNGTHVRDSIDLKRTMMIVIIALIPCLLFGIYNTGYQHFLLTGEAVSFWEIVGKGALVVLPLVVVSYGAGLFVEFIFAIKNGHSVQEGFLVSGMLIPLIMPADVPLWMVAVATIFAVVIGKEVFGGTGMNILNVALTARAFLFFAYPTKMSGNEVWITGFDKMEGVDASSGATALGDLASFMQETPALENVAQFQQKYSMMDSFLGFIPGSVGETSVLMCLIGAGLLLWTGIASWRIMISFFFGGFVMASVLNLVGGNGYFELPALHQLMVGGFMFGLVFMATDPVTASQTNSGKLIYGFLAGFLGILIRMVNPAYPEGIMLAILIANVFAPLIDHMVIRANVNRRNKRLKTA
ncbi:MAG: NADH:ubiquinone reductase (Na(+)-transporting) subunit B [Flavobacteriales bacterium]|nr:NADH:ubiquinone reductase (Na(+)-transporting) subunit B [Flavobacteriales bacterium]